MPTLTLEERHKKAATRVYELSKDLERACENYVDTGVQLGEQNGLNGHLQPCNVHVLRDRVRSCVLFLLKSLKLSGRDNVVTKGKFNRALSLGHIVLQDRI